MLVSRLSIALVCTILLIDAIWIVISDTRVDPSQILSIALIAGVSATVPLLLQNRTYSSERVMLLVQQISDFQRYLAFLMVSWSVLRVFNHVSMTSAFPYADDRLADWDRALGLDWHGYFALVQNNALLRTVLDFSYTSLTLLSFLAFLLLFALGDYRRIRYFFDSLILTALICMSIGFLFPAKAAVVHYFGETAILQNFVELPGTYHMEHMHQLRGPGPASLDLTNLPGLVTFPSFHTAAAIIVAASFAATRFFTLAALYAGIVIASTPVFGSHYMVDILAGALVAVCVAVVCGRWQEYRPLFQLQTAPSTAKGTVTE